MTEKEFETQTALFELELLFVIQTAIDSLRMRTQIGVTLELQIGYQRDVPQYSVGIH
jgi:hypothetical protein